MSIFFLLLLFLSLLFFFLFFLLLFKFFHMFRFQWNILRSFFWITHNISRNKNFWIFFFINTWLLWNNRGQDTILFTFLMDLTESSCMKTWISTFRLTLWHRFFRCRRLAWLIHWWLLWLFLFNDWVAIFCKKFLELSFSLLWLFYFKLVKLYRTTRNSFSRIFFLLNQLFNSFRIHSFFRIQRDRSCWSRLLSFSTSICDTLISEWVAINRFSISLRHWK